MIETTLTGLTIGFRFVFLLSSLQACGLALSLALFSKEIADDAPKSRKHMRLWAILCALCAFAYVLTISLALAMDFGAGSNEIVQDYLYSTGHGEALMIQLASCVAILIHRWLAVIGAVFLLGSFTYVGHVGGGYANLALLYHLIIGAMWFAILAPLRRLALRQDTVASATALGHAFGDLAQFFVPLSVVFGGVLAWSVSGSLGGLLTTTYGWVLISKILCTAGLLWAGALNKLRLVPRMKAGDLQAAKTLATVVRIEWWMFVAIIAITTILTTVLTPP